MKQLTIVKIGGNVIDNNDALKTFLDEFKLIEGIKILVHGGGKIATRTAQSMGIEATMIDGRRVTDIDMLKVVTMVYGGLVNKNIVATLQNIGVNAIGLTGADGAIITSEKRNPKPIDYGYVGDPITVNIETAKTLLNAALVPIIAPLTHADGEILNTNADTIAQTLATALSGHYSVNLCYKFEKSGVLLDVDDETTLIKHITPSIFQDLKSKGAVHSGMIPKIENALSAAANGVDAIFIGQTKITQD